MRNYKILVLFFVIVLFVNNDLYSQASNGGVPRSFHLSLTEDIEIFTLPVISNDSLLQIDNLVSGKNSNRFGIPIEVDLGLKNIGKWSILDNGDKIWRLKIQSKNAFSINLIYNDFWLPDGSDLFIYNEDTSIVYGAFTPELSNNKFDEFATDLVSGKTTILEYYEPKGVKGAKLQISKIIHGYKNTFKNHGDSQDCHNDVNCSQGDAWCVEKRSVSIQIFDDNTRWASGCLINNVREDLTPYYLTADHILYYAPGAGSEINTWVFRFQYWSSTCNQEVDAIHWQSITGATLIAKHEYSDFALLKLNSKPKSGSGIIYAGWELSSAPQSGVTIHHPAGDVMKISNYGNQIVVPYLKDDYIQTWLLKLDQGMIEGGSSGAPLFNENHKIVGQVHGTNESNFIACNNVDGDAVFGRFGSSWNGPSLGSSINRLKDWLDPDNTFATSVGPASPRVYLLSKTLTSIHKFAAVGEMHIAENGSGPCNPMVLNGPITPFTTEVGADVEFKAKSIRIMANTQFKEGSTVTITAVNSIDCDDGLTDGDAVSIFCNNHGMNTGYDNSEDNEQFQPVDKEDNKFLNRANEITLFPNPNLGTFEILFSNKNSELSEIIIYDISGKVVIEMHDIIEMRTSVDMSNFEKGIYLVQVINSENSYSKKVVLK